MSGSLCRWVTSVLICFAAASLSACGSAGGNDAVVAKVSSTPITKSAVNHWMYTLIGGDYYELSARHTVPEGLVSDPPDYQRCVRQLEHAAAASPKKIVHLTALELLTKCRQLNEALREQATSYLIAAQWVVQLNRDLGITASKPEVDKLFKQLKAREYPTEESQRRVFASQHLTLDDELFILMLDVLRNKDSQRVKVGGQKAFDLILAAGHRLNSKINCHTGYVVAHCRQYTGGEEQTYRTTPSPAVLMEQVAAIATGRCINFEACLKS